MARTVLHLALAFWGSACLLVGQQIIAPRPSIQGKGCPAKSTASSPEDPPGPDDFVALERSSCFGSCPAYTVKVRGDGQVTWQGKDSVQTPSLAASQVAPEAAMALIEKFRAAGFWGLCERYDRTSEDAPTAYATVHIGDGEKRVSYGYNTAPAWLRQLDREVDALTDTHYWIHGDPRMETIEGSLHADGPGPKPGLTLLMQASFLGDIGKVRSELSANVDANAQDSSGWTALMYAAEPVRPEGIQLLLDYGADPNLRSYRGQTAIMAATRALYAPEEKVRKLVAAKADINAQDSDGKTALMMAVRQFERPGLVTALLKMGARTDLRDSDGRTVFDQLESESLRRPSQRADYEKLRDALTNR